ncbi:MAG TPA: DUF998 domain-containing protein [Pseudonocardiaceae bacterium]|nr:DUF998 domain-containing protein [Pseudonocardiaceae bacterium]
MQVEEVRVGEPRETTPLRAIMGRTVWLGSRLLVPFGLLAVALAVTMVVGLHLLPGYGGVNPITGMLSDYGVRPDGWVFDTALDIMSVGSVALLIKMALHGVVRGRATFLLMVSWCLCLVGIATFTKDPNTATQTIRGAIHLYATAAACVSLPVASMVIGWQHRRDRDWRRWSWTAQGLALISVPCFLPFLISFFVIRMSHSPGINAVPTGLVERLMGGVDVVILVVLALWAHRAARTRQLVAQEPAAAAARPGLTA